MRLPRNVVKSQRCITAASGVTLTWNRIALNYEHNTSNCSAKGGFLERMLYSRSILMLTVWMAAFCLFESAASADSIRVSSPRFHSHKELKLRPGQTGEVKVFLTSYGDALGGFKVFLLKELNQAVAQTGVSDDSGLVVFEKIPPGRYIVVLERARVRNEEASATVAVGDFFVTPSKREVPGVSPSPS